MTVNKERVQELVDALRSGQYTQGNGQLRRVLAHDDSRYCCLGIACEISRVGQFAHESSSTYYPFGNESSGSGTHLPRPVKDWYGFASDDPQIRLANGQLVAAIYANDSLRLSLNEIADAFERTYLVD